MDPTGGAHQRIVVSEDGKCFAVIIGDRTAFVGSVVQFGM